MSVVIFSSASVSAPVDPDLWNGLKVTWTSYDGTVWDLTDRTSGAVLAAGEFRGMHFPEVDVQATEAASVAGQRRRSTRAKARQIELPLLVYSNTSSDEFSSTDRAFWDLFDFDWPGTLTVANQRGDSFSIRAFLDSQGDHSDAGDPYQNGFSLYQLALVADRPFWTGRRVQRSWSKVAPATFLPASGAPQFRIMSASSIDTATLTNPGRVSAWLQHSITATTGAVNAVITVDGGTITTPSIPQGQTLLINTDPTNPSAVLNGSSVAGQMVTLGWDPRPIPRGQEVPVSIVINGTAGSVTSSFDPLYFRCRP